MKVKPIKHYAGPNIPTSQILEEHPELLHLVPRRWHGNPTVIAALAGVCVLVSGCRQSAAKPAASRVAPLFQHGDGRGSFGCRAVNPPVFLSESEARQVIMDEAKRAGINFAPYRGAK
jgi:hypothetical protein